jgi:hypothetical protein
MVVDLNKMYMENYRKTGAELILGKIQRWGVVAGLIAALPALHWTALRDHL